MKAHDDEAALCKATHDRGNRTIGAPSLETVSVFAIADTTDDRPNVMYELGLAHALSKPVILLRRMNADGSLPAPPFDFQTQSILGYDDDLDDLRRRLETAVGVLTGRIGPPLTT